MLFYIIEALASDVLALQETFNTCIFVIIIKRLMQSRSNVCRTYSCRDECYRIIRYHREGNVYQRMPTHKQGQLKLHDSLSQIYTIDPGLLSRGVNNSSTCIRYKTWLCLADISITAQDLSFCIQRYEISITMNQTALLNRECTLYYIKQCFIHQAITHPHVVSLLYNGQIMI